MSLREFWSLFEATFGTEEQNRPLLRAELEEMMAAYPDVKPDQGKADVANGT